MKSVRKQLSDHVLPENPQNPAPHPCPRPSSSLLSMPFSDLFFLLVSPSKLMCIHHSVDVFPFLPARASTTVLTKSFSFKVFHDDLEGVLWSPTQETLSTCSNPNTSLRGITVHESVDLTAAPWIDCCVAEYTKCRALFALGRHVV